MGNDPETLKLFAGVALASIAAYVAYLYGGYLGGGIAFFVVVLMVGM